MSPCDFDCSALVSCDDLTTFTDGEEVELIIRCLDRNTQQLSVVIREDRSFAKFTCVTGDPTCLVRFVRFCQDNKIDPRGCGSVLEMGEV